MKRAVPLAALTLALAAGAWLLLDPLRDTSGVVDEHAAKSGGGAEGETPGGPALRGREAAHERLGGREGDPRSPGAAAGGASAGHGAARMGAVATAYPGPPIRDGYPQTRLVVRVVDADGKPVPRAHLNFLQPRWSLTMNAEDGRAACQIDGDYGDLRLQVWGAETADHAPLPFGWLLSEPAHADAGEVVIHLPREEEIRGLVKSSEGRGLGGVLVTAQAVSGEARTRYGGWRDVESTGRSDDAGAFRVGGLGAGDVLLLAEAPPGCQRAERVRAYVGARDVVIVLKPEASAVVTVIDPQGNPVAGAAVAAVPSGVRGSGGGVSGSGSGQVTDARGEYRVPGLDSESTYSLLVTPPRDRADLMGARLDGWRPHDETVTLPRGNAVKGVIRDLQGRPVPDAYIYFKSGPSWKSGNVGKDGTFTLTELPPGDVVLRATAEGDGTRADVSADPGVAEATVRAGTEGVILTIDPGLALTIRVENWLPHWNFRKAILLIEGARNGRRLFLGGTIHRGTFRWIGIEAGAVCTLWIPPDNDDLSVLQRNVAAGSGEVAVRLVPGRSITGRLTMPAGHGRAVVSAVQYGYTFQAWGQIDAEGRYEIRGLPEGTSWKIDSGCYVGTRVLNASTETDVPVGGTADLVLKSK